MLDNVYKAYVKLLESNNYSIVPLTNAEHAKQAISLGVSEFSPDVNNDHAKTEKILSEYDPQLSRAVLHNGNVVGAYFLRHHNIDKYDDKYSDNFHSDIKDKSGVEGIGLVIHPDHRGHGVGTKLKDYTKTIKADYIWGYQLKSLNNIDHWLKRRKLISENPDEYVTYQKL